MRQVIRCRMACSRWHSRPSGTQCVSTTDGSQSYRFDITGFRKYCLLNGLDEIGLTLRHSDKIAAFEARRKAQHPWYF